MHDEERTIHHARVEFEVQRLGNLQARAMHRVDHLELALAIRLEQTSRRIAPPDHRPRSRLAPFTPFQVERIRLPRRTAGDPLEAHHPMLARMRHPALEIFGKALLIQSKCRFYANAGITSLANNSSVGGGAKSLKKITNVVIPIATRCLSCSINCFGVPLIPVLMNGLSICAAFHFASTSASLEPMHTSNCSEMSIVLMSRPTSLQCPLSTLNLCSKLS